MLKIITTDQSGLKMSEGIPPRPETGSAYKIFVDEHSPRQTVLGFGGAFTEAAALTLSKMSAPKRQSVIDMYFDKTLGIGYSLGRIAIASSDFAAEQYDYVADGDAELSTFDMSREDKWVFPLIKDAEKARGGSVALLATPWSPPAFMKDNNSRLHGGRLKNEFYGAWAQHFVKFIQTARSKGLELNYITVQNEPAAKQTWDSCLYSAQEERDFVKVLGLALEKHGLSDVNILIHDHNRDILFDRAKTIYDDPDAAKYIWGAAVHWYVCEDFTQCGRLAAYRPDKHLLFTEGCQEGGVHLGAWRTGERYARNIIGDMNNGVEGYIEWNLALDETGGPNHVGNLCDAPVICDTKNDIVHINSSYYCIAHFSKYIMPGAVILPSSAHSDSVKCLAAKNPDGSVVLVVLNETDTAQTVSALGSEFDLPPRSVSTLIKK